MNKKIEIINRPSSLPFDFEKTVENLIKLAEKIQKKIKGTEITSGKIKDFIKD